MNPYEILKISPIATEAAIKIAYRLLSKTLHPDAGGGEEAFKELRRAYDILMCPKRRKLYDEQGITDEKAVDAFDKVQEQAVRNLQAMFLDMLQKLSPEELAQIDFLRGLKFQVESEIVHTRLEKAKLKGMEDKQRRYLEVTTKRLKRKGKSPDFITTILQGTIEAIALREKVFQEDVKLLETMLDILNDYTFEFAA